MQQFETILKNVQLHPPASVAMISEAECACAMQFPEEYVTLVLLGNGGEGWIGDNPIQFWPVDEIVRWNHEYRVSESAPGLIVFASNGGGEAYGFDTRLAPYGIVKVPFIGMSWQDALPVGITFQKFLESLYNETQA